MVNLKLIFLLQWMFSFLFGALAADHAISKKIPAPPMPAHCKLEVTKKGLTEFRDIYEDFYGFLKDMCHVDCY